jgi:hypothetical protein
MARAFAQPLAQWPNFHPAFSLSKSTQLPIMTSDSRKYIDGEKRMPALLGRLCAHRLNWSTTTAQKS